MNKQEAIDIIETMGPYSQFQDEPLPKTTVINIINHIDEPQKIVIPKFVAEWIEYCKSNNLTLLGAFEPVSEHGIGLATNFTLEAWKCTDWAKRNQDIFARAWIDGYEVEHEKRYKVTLPSLHEEGNVLHFADEDEVWFFGHDFNDNVEIENDSRFHTKSELEKAGFGGVFDNPMFKVEEVE